MNDDATAITEIPRALESYPSGADQTLAAELAMRVHIEPFNAIATGIFLLAILHTFAAARFAALAHRVQHRHDEAAHALGRPASPSLRAEAFHFLGEVEVVFGLWAVVLVLATTAYAGWEAAIHYVNDRVNYTEPLFVVVIMALASTRPIVGFAESALRYVAAAGGATPAAWWVAILTIGPLLGSFITEPAAMTICALLLARQFYDLQPSTKLKYATLGVLFVNVSIGGTLTPFAAPPVLMVARPWDWNIPFMMGTLRVACRRRGRRLDRGVLPDLPERTAQPRGQAVRARHRAARGRRSAPAGSALGSGRSRCLHGVDRRQRALPGALPRWVSLFLGFARATAPYQSRIELKTPLLVGFFLAGLVIHGGLQGWWIAPVLGSLAEVPLFLGATVLTAFNDNALITYLATLVPNLGDELKVAVVQGAVVGGGLTVIANAPNPAGQALLSRFFGGAVSPLWLIAGASLPTLIAALAFRLL